MQSDEMVCNCCGLVIEDSPLENRPITSRAEVPSISTAGTNNIDGRIYKSVWLLTTKEKNLKAGFSKIDLIASNLSLPEIAVKEAKVIFNKCMDMGLAVGRDFVSFAYASVYASCNICEIPKTPLEVIAFSEINKKKMLRAYRILKDELKLKVEPMDPADLVPRFASRLHLQEQTMSKALELLQNVKKTSICSGKNPQTIAAACIYLAAKMQGEQVTQRDIANSVGVIEVTIRKRSREIRKEL